MGIENKIPTSLRKSQQVKADCSCWMKSMNLETATLPLPLSPLFPPRCFLFPLAEKGNGKFVMTFRVFTTSTSFRLPSSVFFFFCCFLSSLVFNANIDNPPCVGRLLAIIHEVILQLLWKFNHISVWEPELSSAVFYVFSFVCFYYYVVHCAPLCVVAILGRI